MNELVERLTKGLHPIAAERSASAQELREQIQRGFVLLKFPNTRGGTELGSQLDLKQTRLDGCDFANATGTVRLVGNLTLNYDKVQLVADIDLASLKGTGQLILIEEAGGAQQARPNGSVANESTAHGSAGSKGNGAAGAEASNGKAEARSKAGAKKKARGKKAA
jgi:hypothetical protein